MPGPSPSFRALRILVVEDAATLRDLFCRFLQTNGHLTECAASLAEARDAMARMTFDVLLVDLDLPDGDGIELLPNLPASCRLVSWSGIVNCRVDPTQPAWVAHFEKPVPAEELLELLHRIANTLRMA